jgi:O-antigen/teichoic acid export membrane protein
MVLGIGLSWGIILPLVAAAVTMAVWPWLADLLSLGVALDEARQAALWLLLSLLIDGLAMPWRGVLEGNQHYAALSWLTAGTALIGAAVAVATVRLGGGLAELAASVAATSATRTCWTVAAARKRAPWLRPSLAGVNRADLRNVSGYGLRVQVTAVSGAVNLELDRFILSGFFGPAVAGGFDLGGRLVNLLRLPPAYALVALFPMAVSRTAEHGPGWLERFNLRVTWYLTAFTATGAAVLAVAADPLVRAWLGHQIWWAAANIAILAPAYAVNLVSGATALLARVEGRPGGETVYAVVSMVLNLALTWPLLRLLGPAGVPVATAVAVVVATTQFMVSYHRVTGRPIGPMVRTVWPPLAAAILGALVGALAAPLLPDGPGRASALLAVVSRASVVVLVAGLVLGVITLLSARPRDWLSTMVGEIR